MNIIKTEKIIETPKIVKTNLGYQEQIEALLDQSFGLNRQERTSYAVRRGSCAISNMSFVIIDVNIDIVIASIACWPIYLFPVDENTADNPISMVMVGPIVVSPNHQNMGYGRQLVNHVIEIAKQQGHKNLMMIGDPEYYGQFGFAAMENCEWILPGEYEKHRLLIYNNVTLPQKAIIGPNIDKRPREAS